jgi:geranylgeranyl diphosphate synthase type II
MRAAPSPRELTRHIRGRVDAELEQIRTSAPDVLRLIEAYLERPAKLVRPMLLIESAIAHGAEHEEAVLDLAAGTELLHVLALIHDDRIDGVDRENRPIEAQDRTSALRVLAGDLLHTIADGLIAETVVRYRLPEAVLATVREVSALTVAGQARNIRFLEDHERAPSLADLFALYDAKTGYYTFVAPLRLGAFSAGGASPDTAPLDELGLILGRAFQLQDDAEDVAALLAAGRDDVPRWEFNLLAAYLTETGDGGGGNGIGGAGRPAAGVDTSRLRAWSDEILAGLRGEAQRAVAQLALDAAGRRRLSAFADRLFDTVTAPGASFGS